jgi:SH3-like domain-containing protein
VLSGCGGGDAGGAPERELLLVSGRDDHGLLAQERVTLTREPGAEAGSQDATVADGTLVRVVATRGEWARVRSLEGPRAEGWVNDYHLRGTVHVCAPELPRSAQAQILSLGVRGVQVRTIEGARVATVPRESLSELPC